MPRIRFYLRTGILLSVLSGTTPVAWAIPPGRPPDPFSPISATPLQHPEQLPPPPRLRAALPLARNTNPQAPVWIGALNGRNIYETATGFTLEDPDSHAEHQTPAR